MRGGVGRITGVQGAGVEAPGAFILFGQWVPPRESKPISYRKARPSFLARDWFQELRKEIPIWSSGPRDSQAGCAPSDQRPARPTDGTPPQRRLPVALLEPPLPLLDPPPREPPPEPPPPPLLAPPLLLRDPLPPPLLDPRDPLPLPPLLDPREPPPPLPECAAPPTEPIHPPALRPKRSEYPPFVVRPPTTTALPFRPATGDPA